MSENNISYYSISESIKEICKQLQENENLDNDNAIVVNEKLIFQKGDLVVLGSRPGIGKTAFAISLTRRLSVEQNIPIGFISPETNKHHISLRFLSQITEVEYKKIKYRKLAAAFCITRSVAANSKDIVPFGFLYAILQIAFCGSDIL